MTVAQAYTTAAGEAVELLRSPEVAQAWERPSALAEMTVGGLAAHLAYQIFSVEPALEGPASTETPIPLLEHYADATWIGAPLDDEVNTGIRERAEGVGAAGARAIRRRAADSLAGQRTRLAGLPGGRVVFMPHTGCALTLDDFLTTRLMELVVHMDDLVVSVGLPARELPEAAFDPVLVLLARMSARRHGQAALLRALTRAERAPAAVNAL